MRAGGPLPSLPNPFCGMRVARGSGVRGRLHREFVGYGATWCAFRVTDTPTTICVGQGSASELTSWSLPAQLFVTTRCVCDGGRQADVVKLVALSATG